jgi:MFS family permease
MASPRLTSPQPAVPARRLTPFVVLESTAVLAGVANGITMVAFPWLVLETTGDATATATIAAVTALPLLLSMLFTGVVVDRFGRRPVAIVSDLLSMLSVVLVPVLALTVGLELGLLLLVAALGAVFDPAGVTARETMLPEAARTAGLSLERANGLHDGAYNIAFLIGPGLGGILVATVGTTATFWATAAAFALSALLMSLTRMPGGARVRHGADQHGLLKATGEGLAFLWRDRLLRTMAILGALLVGVWLPVEGVVLPYIYNEADQPGRLGLLITAMSAGGVVGALLYAAWGTRLPRRWAFVGSLILCAVPCVGLALLPAYPVMLLMGVLTGVFFGAVSPINNLALQNRTPERLRGRVVGAMGSSAYAAGPLGYLVAGPLVDAWGPQPVLLLMTGSLLLVSIASAFLPSLAMLDAPPVPGSAGHPDHLAVGPDVRLVEAELAAHLADEPQRAA